MFSMPIVDLLAEGRKLSETGRRVSVLWQHEDTLVFLARGREYRSEFHINPSDETMQMIRGGMRLHYRTPEGKEEVAVIAEGSLIYTPAGTPHSPRFPADAFALISERKRRAGRPAAFGCSAAPRWLRSPSHRRARCRWRFAARTPSLPAPPSSRNRHQCPDRLPRYQERCRRAARRAACTRATARVR